MSFEFHHRTTDMPKYLQWYAWQIFDSLFLLKIYYLCMLGNSGYFLSSVEVALEISAEWSVKQFGFSFVGPDLVSDCLKKKVR